MEGLSRELGVEVHRLETLGDEALDSIDNGLSQHGRTRKTFFASSTFLYAAEPSQRLCSRGRHNILMLLTSMPDETCASDDSLQPPSPVQRTQIDSVPHRTLQRRRRVFHAAVVGLIFRPLLLRPLPVAF